MSTDASIFVRFREQVVPSRLWKAFSENGWGRDLDGSVSLLTPENFSRAEWDCLPDADLSRVADWFSELDPLATPSYGFLLVHEDSEIGGHFFVRGAKFNGASMSIFRMTRGLSASWTLACAWSRFGLFWRQ